MHICWLGCIRGCCNGRLTLRWQSLIHEYLLAAFVIDGTERYRRAEIQMRRWGCLFSSSCLPLVPSLGGRNCCYLIWGHWHLGKCSGSGPLPCGFSQAILGLPLIGIPVGNWKSHFWDEATGAVMWTFFHQKNVGILFPCVGGFIPPTKVQGTFFIELKVCMSQWSPTWLSIGIPVRVFMNMHLWPNIMPSEWVRIFRVTKILNFQKLSEWVPYNQSLNVLGEKLINNSH